MTPETVEAFFTRESGDYVFARWGRPLAPVVFGVEEETLVVIKGAIEALCQLTGHTTVETDPELGSNFMWFFVRSWDDLRGVPNLDRLIPDLEPLLTRLSAADANQYRIFRFDEAGAIRACFVFLRMDAALSEMPAEGLALGQAAQSMVLWSDLAFRAQAILATAGDKLLLRPDIADLLRVAYDPILPPVAHDKSHALRLAARLGRAQ